jgi:ketosteroid isomerase-like protein
VPTLLEQAILRASNAGPGDFFGESVAISGDRAIIGAFFEDGPSDGLTKSGAAYVFERDANGSWTEVALLRASNAGSDDNFGRSVAISGDKAIVGAPAEDGPSDSFILRGSGAAYVFERDGSGIWGTSDPERFQTETNLLRASNPGFGDRFGESVAISGDRAIVGTIREDGPSDGLLDSGAGYIFERDASGTWGVPDLGGFQTETALLRASNAGASDLFGRSVAISGDRAIVGAADEDSPSDVLFSSGAAYIFERDASGTWGMSDPNGFQTETALLRASNAGVSDQFGISVAISGDKAIVGASGEDGPSGELPIGAAYTFEREASGIWGVSDPNGFQTETVLLRASNAGIDDDFGVSVAISGDRAIVGASGEDGPSDGLSIGAAYVFALPTDASAAPVSGPGLVQFGTTGTTIDFAAGTSGSGTVTVARFDGAAVGTDLLP